MKDLNVLFIKAKAHKIFKLKKKSIDYYNNKRIQAKTKWMPPALYRKASMCSP